MARSNFGMRNSFLVFLSVGILLSGVMFASQSQASPQQCSQIFGAQRAVLPFGSFETARVLVRPATREDAAQMAEFLTHPDNIRMSGDEIDMGTVQYLVSQRPPRQGGSWSMLSYSIVSKETGRVIGLLQMAKVSLQPELSYFVSQNGEAKTQERMREAATVGYSLSRAAWGGGIMTEVVTTAIQVGMRDLGVTQFFAETIPANIGSQRVLEKSGFRRIGETPAHVYFEIPSQNQAQQPAQLPRGA